jgi:hypothetical protein
MSNPYMNFSFWPEAGTNPTAEIRDDLETVHIGLAGRYGMQTVQITLHTDPDRRDDTLRYLRELAAEVSRVADELERQRTAEWEAES